MEINYLSSFILAFIQSATEFLPVSSSGHLQVYKLLNSHSLENDLSFDIILHFATMMATLFYFRKQLFKIVENTINDIKGNDLITIVKKVFDEKTYAEKSQYGIRYLMMIITASIPIGVVGVLWKSELEHFFNNIKLVGSGFIYTTSLLFSTLFLNQKIKSEKNSFLGWRVAIVVGLFQMIAIMPGVSRSGSCLVVALWLGVSRRSAAEFAFLISLPVISGAMLLGMLDLLNSDIYIHWDKLFFGFTISLFLGWLFLKWLMLIFSRGKLYYFAIYTFFLGLYCLY